MRGLQTEPMLEMRPGCERCDADLAPNGSDARICSFECTFCVSCAAEMDETCPNCGGVLVLRPSRAESLLDAFPARGDRVFSPALRG